MSLFQGDLKNDAILCDYLDGIYARAGLAIRRITDINQQHLGVDLILEENGKNILIDEKAQMHYLNKDLPTFAFEIGYFKNGDHRKGWLFDEHKLTHDYFLIVHIHTDGKPLTKPDQIQSCKILRVGRERLIGELIKMGLTYEHCLAYEKKAGEEELNGKMPIAPGTRSYFYRSAHLEERPFNIVIRLEFLATIGTWIYQ